MAALRFKPYQWMDVEKDVSKVNPELASIINDLSPSSEFTFYKVKYPFGSQILQRGDLYLPGKNGLVSLKDAEISPTVKKSIGYNLYSNPVTMVLQNSAEMFIPIEDRIIPYGIAHPGDVFGLWTVFDGLISHCPPLFLWDMTAGARSVSMLSKISDSVSHRRLIQQFQLNQECPKNLLDHWAIFKEIANDPLYGDPWEVELLFFGRSWIDQLDDIAWVRLRSYLQNMAWKSSAFWRNQYTSNLMWTHIQRKENIKASPYIADITRHLFAVAVGAVPGFGPAMDTTLGPFDRIEKAYVDFYRMRDYPPIVMQPEYFSSKLNRTVYNSLQFLSVMELSPKSNDRSSTIADLYAVQSLLKKYLRGITHGGFNMKGTLLNEVAETVKFDFYHSNSGQYPHIANSRNIAKKDPAFEKILKQYPGTHFPSTGSFLRGCVSISPS